jgi:hypothetical protein
MRWRFSLSALLAAVLLLGCLFGAIRRWREIKAARVELKELGVTVQDGDFYQRFTRFPTDVVRDREIVLDFFPHWHLDRRTDLDFERAVDLAARLPKVAGVKIIDEPRQIDLTRFNKLRSLRMLDLSGAVQIRRWEVLQGFGRLDQLVVLHNPYIDDRSADAIRNNTDVRWLNIGGTQVTDSGVKCLLQHLDLRGLGLRDTRISSKSFLLLGEERGLEVVDISASCRPQERVLDILDERVFQRAVAGLDDAPLRELETELQTLEDECVLPTHSRWRRGMMDGGCSFEFRRLSGGLPYDPTAPAVVADADFPSKLRWLDCSGWDFSPRALDHVSTLANLEYLNLSGHSLSEHEMRSLGRCTSLRRVGLADTDIGDWAIDYLIQLPRLQALDVRGTIVSGTKLREVCKVRSLARLYVSRARNGIGISEDGLERMMPLLSGKTLHIDCFPRTTDPRIRALESRYPDVDLDVGLDF